MREEAEKIAALKANREKINTQQQNILELKLGNKHPTRKHRDNRGKTKRRME